MTKEKTLRETIKEWIEEYADNPDDYNLLAIVEEIIKLVQADGNGDINKLEVKNANNNN